MHKALALCLLFLSGGLLFAQQGPQVQILQQSDIEESVRRSYPPLLAAFQEINQANADLLAARGKFDLKLKGHGENNALGYYEYRVGDVGAEQPIRWGGIDLFGGWRIGQGKFPVYEGKYETRSGGEYKIGARVPLIQDHSIDIRRADLQKTTIGQQTATLSVEQQRLAIMNSAVQRYWLWVAAGNRLRLAENVLSVAQSRQALLEKSAEAGLTPAIDAVDNRKAILQRQGQVVEATRALQAAALDLSLFYRDSAGQTIIPGNDQLPKDVPRNQAGSPEEITASLALAMEKRPDAKRIGTQLTAAEVDLKLAKNQKLPELDLVTTYTTERGESPDVRRGPTEFRAGVNFSMPVQRRTAEGKIRSAEAKIAALKQKEQYARDTIREEVQDAISALHTITQRVDLAQQELAVAKQLEAAERTKFDYGEGTLFLLNLREQATLEAAVKNVTAIADHQRAVSSYRYTMGDL
jgi:outer membrane protein, heavy metal efflux system